MMYKPFGKTGKKISAISMGGMRFDKPENIEANAEVVFHAYQKGVNYFDTAPGYCNDKSEDIVGTALRQMKPGTFYVSTKTFADNADLLNKELERSLKRLGVPKIHFYHIWCITSLEAWQKRQPGVAAAIKAKEQGLIEHLCVSSHLGGKELAQVLDEGPFEGVTLGYCAINFFYREAAVTAAGKKGLGVVTMNPLGGGVIPQNADRFDYLRSPGDRSVTEAALRFNVSNPDITSALVGCTTPQHVDEAVASVADFQPYSLEQMDSLRKKVTESFNDLCTGCGYCLPCPQGVEIPKMMDAYNMKTLNKGDRQQILNRLKWHWSTTAEAATACTQCRQCEQRCTQHLPISERMKEIADLAEKKK